MKYLFANSKRFVDSLNDDGVCDDKQFGGMVIVWRAMTIMTRALYAFLDEHAENSSSTPLLHACVGIGDHCPRSFLDIILRLDPEQGSRRDSRGNLPLHIAAASSHFIQPESKAVCIRELIRIYERGPSSRNHQGSLPLTEGIICSGHYSTFDPLSIFQPGGEYSHESHLLRFLSNTEPEAYDELLTTLDSLFARPKAGPYGTWLRLLLLGLEEEDLPAGLKPFILAASLESMSLLDVT